MSDVFSSGWELTIGAGWLAVGGFVSLVWAGPKAWCLARTVRGYAAAPSFQRLLSHLVGSRDLDVAHFVAADGASACWVDARRRALDALAAELNDGRPVSAQWSSAVRDGLSDLRFADANRVPFPFARLMRERFNTASVAAASEGPYLVDLDGNRSLDVSGSYGVNVAGYDRYKNWIEAGWQKVRELGAVLGPLHPITLDNVAMLKEISGQEEVSFHLSGTEAVMSAIRLVRFNTRRKKIVCFSGAYHGWWDGVQPGLGSERAIDDVLPLREMDAGSLQTIRARAGEIAGVLINPVQSFHPNSPPPNDAVLLASDVRKTQASTGKYGEWLEALRRVCTECGVPLIFDEIYSGFRLAPGGAQAYFGVKADMVLYGKTVAGGVPIGVVCGPKRLMQRFDPRRPMRIAYVVGTFSAYPLAMGVMHEFLTWVKSDEAAQAYARLGRACADWIEATNGKLAEAGLPMKVVNLGSIWTVTFQRPSRFNWLLQYYLRAEGVNLSWVGTGRCLFSMDLVAEDFDRLGTALVRAGRRMGDDKWWLSEAEQPGQERTIRNRLIKDMVASVMRVPEPLQAFYSEVMRRKHDDHVASHSHPTNQFFHLLSSTTFLVCYVLAFFNLPLAVWAGVIALFVRQAGHALIEPPCHDKEQPLLGFDTRSKSWIVGGFLLIPLFNWWLAPAGSSPSTIAAHIGVQWFAFAGLVVLGRVGLLIRRHGAGNSLVWFVKLVTDPITDIKAYYRSLVRPFS